MTRRALFFACVICLGQQYALLAQPIGRTYGGILFGVAALSSDGGATTGNDETTSLSFYSPENGLALSILAGVHLAEYFSVQANYMWNRNALTLFASRLDAHSGIFHEQMRRSQQHALVFDGLIYFRNRHSGIRPYLATGLSILRFHSTAGDAISVGLPVPAPTIASTRLGLRSSVGIDITISRHLRVRYSFSETISSNPISPHLDPRGRRGLANFQNLFGIVSQF